MAMATPTKSEPAGPSATTIGPTRVASFYRFWLTFFQEAGIPSPFSEAYALAFNENRLRPDMLPQLDKETLCEMGVCAIGDKFAIIRHAKLTNEKLRLSEIVGDFQSDPNPFEDSEPEGEPTVVPPLPQEPPPVPPPPPSPPQQLPVVSFTHNVTTTYNTVVRFHDPEFYQDQQQQGSSSSSSDHQEIAGQLKSVVHVVSKANSDQSSARPRKPSRFHNSDLYYDQDQRAGRHQLENQNCNRNEYQRVSRFYSKDEDVREEGFGQLKSVVQIVSNSWSPSNSMLTHNRESQSQFNNLPRRYGFDPNRPPERVARVFIHELPKPRKLPPRPRSPSPESVNVKALERQREIQLNTPIAMDNKGFEMLTKMGWDHGKSLGNGKGIREPIRVEVRQGRKGLGHETNPYIQDFRCKRFVDFVKSTNPKLARIPGSEHAQNDGNPVTGTGTTNPN